MPTFKPEELVERYVDAWDRHDVDAILALMDAGASYYDGFWRETCTGRDLARYFRDEFATQPYRYEQVGDLILTQDSITFRYNAYEQSDNAGRTFVYSGAEILTLRNGLIVTVTDYYCHSDPDALKEAAELASRRHGVSRYANGGLGAWTASQFKETISYLMERDRIYRDPALTVAKLAAQLDCPEKHVVQVIVSEYGSNFDDFVERLRVNYARDLLLELSDAAAEHILPIAKDAGFSSVMAFRSAFKSNFGVYPTEYVRQQTAT